MNLYTKYARQEIEAYIKSIYEGSESKRLEAFLDDLGDQDIEDFAREKGLDWAWEGHYKEGLVLLREGQAHRSRRS